FDPYLHFGPDEAEPLSMDTPSHQPRARHADFRLRCARDDRAIGIPNDDITDAQCGPAVRVAFNLGSANLNLVAVTEVFLHCGGEPGSDYVELDWSAAEPPPQSHKGKHHHARGRAERVSQCAKAIPPLDETGTQTRIRAASRRPALG